MGLSSGILWCVSLIALPSLDICTCSFKNNLFFLFSPSRTLIGSPIFPSSILQRLTLLQTQKWLPLIDVTCVFIVSVQIEADVSHCATASVCYFLFLIFFLSPSCRCALNPHYTLSLWRFGVWATKRSVSVQSECFQTTLISDCAVVVQCTS